VHSSEIGEKNVKGMLYGLKNKANCSSCLSKPVRLLFILGNTNEDLFNKICWAFCPSIDSLIITTTERY